jgi:hypothetical protein
MTNLRPSLCGTACTLLFFAGAPALAQNPPPTAVPLDGGVSVQEKYGEREKLDLARKAFDVGNGLHDRGMLSEAEDVYLVAWKLKKSYDVAANLGNVEADLKHPGRAAAFLAFALREFPVGGKPSLRESLAKLLAEVRQQVGALRVQLNVPGAEVLVDGVSLGSFPLPDDVFVEPGPHRILAKAAGYRDAQATAKVAKGQAQEVRLELKPKTRGPAGK